MTTRNLLIFLLLCTSIFCWQVNYGTARRDICTSVRPVSGGGFIASGYSENPMNDWYDAWFVKLNMMGEMEWDLYFGDEWYQDRGYDGIEVDGGFLFTGWTGSYGARGNDIFVLKVNETGDTLWHRKYGTPSADEAYVIHPTEAGNFIIAGKTYGYGTGASDGYVVKIDARGDTIWTNHFGTTNHETIHDIVQISDGSFVAVGHSWNVTGIADTNIYVVKINNDGSEAWSQIWNPGYDDGGWGVCEEVTGNIVVVGFASVIPGHADIYIRRISPDGDSLWAYIYDIPGQDVAHSVVALEDTTLVIAGWSTFNGYIKKIASDGGVIWDNRIGGVRNDRFFSIDRFGDSFVMGGATRSYGLGSPEKEDFFIVTANSEGDAGSDCFPAFVWGACPAPESYVACADQEMIIGIYDPANVHFDVSSVHATRIILSTDGSADTTHLMSGHEDMTIDDRGETLYVSIGGLYEHGDRVEFAIDTVINEDGCVSFPTRRMHFFVDLEPLYVRSLTPPPGSFVDPSLETIIMTADIVDDMAGISPDSLDLHIRWILNDFGRPLHRWNRAFRTNTITTHDAFAEGDSIMVCARATEATSRMFCACDRRSIDTCWVFYIGEDGSDVYRHHFAVSAGWNMFSSPFETPVPLDDYFTSAILPGFIYNPSSGGYDETSTLQTGKGVWLLNTINETITVADTTPALSVELVLERGWNMIGGPAIPVSAATIEGLTTVIPPIFRFHDGEYIAVDTIMPGIGYWCLANARTEISLPSYMMSFDIDMSHNCAEEFVDTTISVEGNVVTIEMLITENVCKDSSTVEVVVDDDTINIHLTEHTAEPCRGYCDFLLDATVIIPESGNYSIVIDHTDHWGTTETIMLIPVVID